MHEYNIYKTLPILAAAVLLAFCCTSACVQADKQKISLPPLPAADKIIGFTEEEANVVYDTNYRSTATLRFYDDMPNVAYISASAFHEIMWPGTTVSLTQYAAGAYELKTSSGTALIDANHDWFVAEDLYSYVIDNSGTTNIDKLRQETSLPYIREAHEELSPSPGYTVFDFTKDNIQIRGDETGVFIPFTTLADIYADTMQHHAAYSAGTIYVNSGNTFYMRDAFERYNESLFDMTSRPEDLAAYSYSEWCFVIENLYGYPESSAIDENLLAREGLDAALKAQGPVGDRIIELMRSTSMAEYFLGTAALNALFADAGHTKLALEHTSNLTESPETELAAAVSGQHDKLAGDIITPLIEQKAAQLAARETAADERIALRSQMLGTETYAKKGDTALCIIDEFTQCNTEAWNNFYAGGCQNLSGFLERTQNDALVTFLRALYRAQDDPEVKNLIIDISNNGGGDPRIVFAIVSLVANEARDWKQDLVTNQAGYVDYEVDRNFDGVFDSSDSDVSFNLNFTVLTSSFSFSSANSLPSLFHDYGIPVLGEQSHGGVNNVLALCTAEGFDYSLASGHYREANRAGENIEGGTPVDIELPYSDFYDLDVLSSSMAQLAAHRANQ